MNSEELRNLTESYYYNVYDYETIDEANMGTPQSGRSPFRTIHGSSVNAKGEKVRRIFYIDVGNLPKVKAEQYLRDVMMRLSTSNDP